MLKRLPVGLPASLINLLRCPADAAPLTSSQAAPRIVDGQLWCASCNRGYPIEGGIVRMLDTSPHGAEEQCEIVFRDHFASQADEDKQRAYEESFDCRLEILQHVAALRLCADSVLLEIGAGMGRFTRLFAPKCRAIVAVDFSLESLRFLAGRLDPNSNVLLVHTDAAKLRVAPGAFSRAFSTTPLDSREQRLAMHRLASDALTDHGLWVFSTERWDLRSRVRHQPRVLRYDFLNGTGSLHFRFLRHEVEREAAPYFARIKSRPIHVVLPFGVRSVLLSRISEHLPVLRDLGDLWLVTAARPIRELVESVPSEASPATRTAIG